VGGLIIISLKSKFDLLPDQWLSPGLRVEIAYMSDNQFPLLGPNMIFPDTGHELFFRSMLEQQWQLLRSRFIAKPRKYRFTVLSPKT